MSIDHIGVRRETDSKLKFTPPSAAARESAGRLSAFNAQTPKAPPPAGFETSSEFVELKVRLHQQLLDMINLSAIEKVEPEVFRQEATEMVKELLAREQIPLSSVERNRLVDEITDEVLGLGPIEPLLKDPSVSDVLVNTYDQVFVERHGVLEPTLVKFQDDKHLLRIIDKIVSRVGRRVDESSPLVDARLQDGSRVNAIIPPLAVDGPLLSIRKFAQIPYDLEKLVAIGSVTPQLVEILVGIVRCQMSVLISGGTGSGKTTFLNACSRHIDDRERIVTIEDAAELQMQQTHVARLETRPANIEGRGEFSQRDLVKNSLRMRPRPDHRRRGARRRSVRHAAGDEHRPRRLDDHNSRQHLPRRAVASGADDRHGRLRSAHARHAFADRVRD